MRQHFLKIGGCFLFILCAFFGCQAPPATPSDVSANPTDPKIGLLLDLPTVKSVERWTLPEYFQQPTETGLVINTANYQIFSTLQDPLILRQIPVFMESALRAYRKFLQHPQPLTQKLKIYVFNQRSQWEDFTRHLAGPEARIFLKIRAGAYYFKGVCVAYHLGRQSNFSVLAHEGWHQFSDLAFKYRLPAWLDEGLATQFEAFQWDNGRVTFKPSLNGSRLTALRESLTQNQTLSLSEIVFSDAGRILSAHAISSSQKNNPKVKAYYAQLYALIRFLREENYGQRHLQLRTILHHAYLGNHWPLSPAQRSEALQKNHNPTRRWNGEVGRLLFQSYIAPDPSQIEPAYRSFCRKIITRLSTR